MKTMTNRRACTLEALLSVPGVRLSDVLATAALRALELPVQDEDGELVYVVTDADILTDDAATVRPPSGGTLRVPYC